jgi:uncharacterized protein with HEPN domain
MSGRVYWRLTDMKAAIVDIRDLLSGEQFSVLNANRATRAAFERYLEILSEASRHVPDNWKAEHSQVPWRRVADLGNHVRHAYHRLDLEILWNIYEVELDSLEIVVDKLIERAKLAE